MKHGNAYTVRNAAAKPVLQAAEQTWHDWVVGYRAARGMGDRPDWALQPLPGFRRVNIGLGLAPALIPALGTTPASTPRVRRRQARFPTLPTPPPSSPASSPTPTRIYFSDDELARPAQKRKFLGVVEISDDEEDAEVRPRKKTRFLGHIDLTI
jgi:hypothetical protein